MKKINTFLLLFSIFHSIFSQEINELDFKRIAKELTNKYIENTYLNDDNNELKEDCVYGKEQDLTLSCISTDWDIKWVTDFDGDTIDDLVIQITDGGLGGGGNAFGYHFTVVTLNEEKKIKETYSFFGGGKLSYALLSIDEVKNGTIYATYEKNPYGITEEENSKGSNEIQLELFIENNHLKEKSYNNCLISEMNKSIFKENLDFKIQRIQSLNSSFNQEQREQLYLNDKTYYYANLTGCDDINLYFTHTFPFKSSLESDTLEIKKTWLEHLQFLKTNTRYKTVLNNLYTQLNELQEESIIIGKYGGSEHQIKLNNDWMGYLFISGNKEQGSFVTFRLIKASKSEEKSFWESLEYKINN